MVRNFHLHLYECTFSIVEDDSNELLQVTLIKAHGHYSVYEMTGLIHHLFVIAYISKLHSLMMIAEILLFNVGTFLHSILQASYYSCLFAVENCRDN